MLDNQIINIRSEVDNWLQSFNEAISQQKNKDESINAGKKKKNKRN